MAEQDQSTKAMSLTPARKAAASITPDAEAATPASVATLTVGADNVVTKEDQLGGGVVITGTLTGALAAGGSVEITLPSGQTRQAAVGADGMSFSLTVTTPADLSDFAVANTVSAYVRGNPDAAVTQPFTAASQRSFHPITATPADPTASTVAAIDISGDAGTVAFVSLPPFANGHQSASLYVEQLATGTTTLITDQANIDFGTGVAVPSLSNDGHLLAYATDDGVGGKEFWLRDLDTGTTTALGAAYLGGNPSLADDGTVVFQGQSGGATVQQIYAAHVTAGVVSLSVVSAPDPADGGTDTMGDGSSDEATISADGSMVVFRSSALDLLAPGDPNASSLTGTFQLYAKALRDNTVTGLHAGQVVLVSLNPDGSLSAGGDITPVISGNGRFIVFENTTDGQAYVRDIATGTTRLVSCAADGTPADAVTRDATISADGRTVAFRSAAFNLLDPSDPAYSTVRGHTELYEKDLVSGKVTLLSEAGYIEADNSNFSPSLSADGGAVAFLSYADNLASGLGPDTDPTTGSAAELGFVTSVPTTPALTFGPPLIALGIPRAQLSGTIDTADAGRGITLADAADPGFSAGPVTVSPTDDPYVESWSASATFSQSGTQTVTASVRGGAGVVVTQSRTFGISFAPSIVIHQFGLNATIAPSLLSAATTTISGTATNAAGQTLSLSLRLAGGNTVSLGNTTVGDGGAWSLGVADKNLAHLGSGDDSLVAAVSDATGALSAASQAVALAVVPTAMLYTYRFTFNDGSFYTGTVAGGGNYPYKPGQTIETSAGSYMILAAAGATAEAAGTVTTDQYYDATTDAFYVPAKTAGGTSDGSAGLGSESDSIDGPLGVRTFAGGVTEAKQASATLYDFTFVYDNGSAYTGTVAGGGNYNYAANQTIATSDGYYKITGSVGATTDTPGAVHTSLYYDTATTQTYVPVLATSGTAAGSLGLGSEIDTLSSPGGSVQFGLGKIEARLRISSTFQFTFTYKDGSYYHGTVTDDGTYDYYVGEKIKTTAGQYEIYSASLSPGATAGDVTVDKYYDVSTKQFYTPYFFPAGSIAGHGGLQSEYGEIGQTNAEAFGWYVSGGDLISVEARQADNNELQFSFTYNDGSYYTGEVIDNGQVFSGSGYSVGEKFGNAYGYYTILKALGPTTDTSGRVYVDTYHDISTNANYTPEKHNKGPDGTTGLGSELDYTDGPEGDQLFGDFGAHEARQSPRTLYDFHFQYKDGSYYEGTVIGDTKSTYKIGSIIKTGYGFYTITGSAASATTDPVGSVTINEYLDKTTGLVESPIGNVATDPHGLGSELGYFYNVEFGQGGALEAKIGDYDVFTFTFRYDTGHFNDSSIYTGTVSDSGGTYGYHLGQQIFTDYGVYTIDGIATSNLNDAPGRVYVDVYYDAATGNYYTPADYQVGNPSGYDGLGSEVDQVGPGAGTTFGKGGAYEAFTNPVTEYAFHFTYLDGTEYLGIVAAPAGTYSANQTIATPYGAYTIQGPLTDTGLQNGAVIVDTYITAGGTFYNPVRYLDNQPAGTSGLFSEYDFIHGPGGLSEFGHGGQYEAHLSANFNFALSTVTSLTAFDGPIAGATIGYLDGSAPPGTLAIDPNQPTATTQADGSYALAPGVGPLVLTGGTDGYTGLPFRGILSSAGQSPVISPITTLIEAVADAKGDTTLSGIAAANALVVSALGLPAGLDLTTYIPTEILNDPTSTAADIVTAEAVYRTGAALLDAETLIDAAGGSGWTALEQVADSLADGSVTDLTDLSALIDRGGLMPDADSAVSTIAAATHEYLGFQLDGLTVPGAILQLISGASIALQGDASSALAAANGEYGTVATDYIRTMAATLQADDQRALANQIACYCRGTAILTDAGERPVETLAIGMNVVTRDGTPMPIRWIGRRAYGGPFLARNTNLRPILISAGALGDDLPRRDLRVSPKHAMFLDGVLVPAECLVNGITIVRDTGGTTVDYFHIELETHAVILAEGALSETFVDDDSRMMFQNASDYRVLYPDEPRKPAQYCAPRVEDGEELEKIRARLVRYAQATKSGDVFVSEGRLRGFVDEVNRGRIKGWAWDEAAPTGSVILHILDNDAVIGRVVADQYRPDLLAAGIGDGRHGFDVTFPGGLSPLISHAIRVRRETDGKRLENCDHVIETLAAHEAAVASNGFSLGGVGLPASPASKNAAPDKRQSYLDSVTRQRITGWAWDSSRPDQPVTLQVIDNGRLIAQIIANQHRQDLEQAGIGNGRYGFDIEIPGGLSSLSAHVVHVRYVADGKDIEQSPAFLAIPTEFDEALESDIANALEAASQEGDQERVLSFLAMQAERVLQNHADSESKRDLRQTHRRLLRRWGSRCPDRAAADTVGLRALIIDDYVPARGRDAGSQAILSHMRSLQELNYSVSFVASQGLQGRSSACSELEADGIVLCRSPFYASVEEVLCRQSGGFDVVYLHRVSNAAKYLNLARQHLPKARIIFGVADLHHIRIGRQAEVEDRPELLTVSLRLKFAEYSAAASADAVITHSSEEATLLRRELPGANVHVVPWAVPIRSVTVPFSDRNGVAFIGNYAHTPNLDAAYWLVREIMPLVWQRNPRMECFLVGSNMPQELKQLAQFRVKPIGAVADLSEVFDQVRLTVAPLRFGAGVKGKVLESLSAGIPCIMSPVAAEGIALPKALNCCVGRSSADLASRLVRLHAGRAAYREAAEAGRTFAHYEFGDSAVTAALMRAVGESLPSRTVNPHGRVAQTR